MHETVNIKNITEAIEKTLSPQFKNLPFNIAEENIQSRTRAVLLMAMCNKFGYILLNTSNKSEAWCWLRHFIWRYVRRDLAIIGDVYKTYIFELAKAILTAKERSSR